MAKKKDSDLYVEEMEVWLEKQDRRIASCERRIESNKVEIKQLLKDNELGRDQIRIIRRRRADASKDLAEHKKDKSKK